MNIHFFQISHRILCAMEHMYPSRKKNGSPGNNCRKSQCTLLHCPFGTRERQFKVYNLLYIYFFIKSNFKNITKLKSRKK